MKEPSKKRPGLAILAKYARGDKKIMKYWSKFIEHDPPSLAAIGLLRRLDRLFGSRESARMVPGSKRLASEIFTRYQALKDEADKSLAYLYYDSQMIPLREGFRPSLMSERRLRFASETGTIDLSVVPVFPGRFEVTGRLEGDGARQTAAVRLKGRHSLRTKTDEFGFFTFGAVNPGAYILHFQSGDKEVVIHDLVLR